jgi:hypothetical protein
MCWRGCRPHFPLLLEGEIIIIVAVLPGEPVYAIHTAASGQFVSIVRERWGALRVGKSGQSKGFVAPGLCCEAAKGGGVCFAIAGAFAGLVLRVSHLLRGGLTCEGETRARIKEARPRAITDMRRR